MKPRSSYFPFPTPPEGAVVLFVLLMVSGCGGGPPFNSYDPPPTFAFKHLAAYPALTTTYLGTRLDGIYLADAASPTFTPTGFVNSFTGVWANFGNWTTINGARWPARWRLVATSGCGAGTSSDVTVLSKMFETVCTPRPVTPSVSPSSFSINAPPVTLTITFNTSDVPPGTEVDVWIVDPDTETIISETPGVLDGNLSIQVQAPDVQPGEYRILVDIDMENSEGGDATLTVTDDTTPSGPDVLGPDDTLYPDEEISSLSGQFHFKYQSDGNLVLYAGGNPIWSSVTDGTSSGFVIMQTDGNLVMYDANEVPVWDSDGSFGHPGAFLQVQDDGNVAIYDTNLTPLWCTCTN
jgi:hypothetical protein